MNTDNPPIICAAYHDELLRLACGDITEPSDALKTHLEACPACRDSGAASRELVQGLQAALEPEALPDELVARIQARLDAAATPTRTIWTGRLRLVCTVAAAAVLTALLVPWGLRTYSPATTGTEATTISLSADDASTIVAAITLLNWDSPEYSVEALEEKIEDIAQTVERDSRARMLLPWGREDDWDVPADDAGRTGLPSPAICAAPRWSDSVFPAAT
jgi:hypothetical protein